MKVRLSPRMEEIVVLVGRDRMPYERIGLRLGIKRATVKSYAESIRDRLGSDLPPRDAITAYYVEHLSEFGMAGSAISEA